jgi:hypothetical protein
MNFQIFSQEFLNKWLTAHDYENYKSLNDQKLIAGTNWLTYIAKSSFSRYDSMWKELDQNCKECMDDNCMNDYNWIIENADPDSIKISKGFKKIKFPNKEVGKIGLQKVENFHRCKKICYEKVNILNVTFAKKLRKFSQDFNTCITLCRGKPIDKETMLTDCFSDCMIKSSYEMANLEYYIKMVHEKIIKEYKEKIFDLPGTDIFHNERFKERDLTPDILKKYL